MVVRTAQDHRKYLRSKRWQELRKRVIERDGYACMLCNVSGYDRVLQVHHRSYDRLNTTGEIRDCITLCKVCHARLHGKGRRY